MVVKKKKVFICSIAFKDNNNKLHPVKIEIIVQIEFMFSLSHSSVFRVS